MSDPLRERLERFMGTQLPHPVWPRLEVLWDMPYDLAGVWTRTGGLIEHLTHDELLKRVNARNRQIKGEKTDPLRYLCEPAEYLALDLEMVRKRLDHPGVQLILWVNGGIRSSKTEFCTRRIGAHFFYTEEAWCWGFHETDTTSRGIQQDRLYDYVPAELKHGTGEGKHKKEMNTKFNFTRGSGFTGSEFLIEWDANDEEGIKHRYGGKFEFRFYGQDEGTMVGQELTCVASDEKVPPAIVRLIDDRLLTRAADTRHPDFLARMEKALTLLEAGKPLPLPLLGAVYHGVQMIGFTPKFGWSPTVAMLLQGARWYGWYDPRPMVQVAMQEAVSSMNTPERRVLKAAELERNPWTLGSLKEVPAFAQPVNARALVACLPTYANKFKGNWTGAVEAMQGKSDEEIARTLFGYVKRDVDSLFGYNDKIHVKEETDMPAEGMICVEADPAPRKPWVMKWYVVDALGRKWVVQEWPCPTWEVEGEGLPGMWAVPSEHAKLNGDAGPAQKMRVNWGDDEWHHLAWAGCMRLAARARKIHGDKCKLGIVKQTLEWADKPHLKLEGEMVMPGLWQMDSRYAGAPSATRGQDPSTVLEEMLQLENAPDWEPAKGGPIENGLVLMRLHFCSETRGLPNLLCLRECVNTQFAWATYTLPEYGSDTKASDEACKDFIDPDRYLLEASPEYVKQLEPGSYDEGGSY